MQRRNLHHHAGPSQTASISNSAGYRYGDDPALVGQANRVAVPRDADFAPIPAVEATIAQLARNPKGYFLMVEWDMHTSDPKKGCAMSSRWTI